MIPAALKKLVAKENLSRAEAEACMEQILSGNANDALIAALLIALRMKGETVDELVGFATAMRRHAVRIFPDGHSHSGEMLVDTCGTGGDACDTFNISTATAFVVAGAGVRVAKHGNRAASSRTGAADVLEQLGVVIDQPPERVRAAIEQIGIGFLFAPAVHTAMKHAMPVRRALATWSQTRLRRSRRRRPRRNFSRRRNGRRRTQRRRDSLVQSFSRRFRPSPRARELLCWRRRQAQRRNHPQNFRPLASLPRTHSASRHRSRQRLRRARRRRPRRTFSRRRPPRHRLHRLRRRPRKTGCSGSSYATSGCPRLHITPPRKTRLPRPLYASARRVRFHFAVATVVAIFVIPREGCDGLQPVCRRLRRDAGLPLAKFSHRIVGS